MGLGGEENISCKGEQDMEKSGSENKANIKRSAEGNYFE